MNDDWPAPDTLLASRYRLVTLLETGGMAEVWHAHDELLGRPVALKLPTTDTFVWKEARAAARLSHPNVAAVHDYSEATRPDGGHWRILVDGRPTAYLCRDFACRLPVTDASALEALLREQAA